MRRSRLIFALVIYKKDAPKAGDGNFKEGFNFWYTSLTDKKDAPKVGDGTSLPY